MKKIDQTLIFLLLMYFHSNVKHLRKKHGFNQKVLGELVKVNATQIGAYELGNSKPSFDGLLVLAKIFDISIDDLIFKNLALDQNGKSNPYPMVEEPQQPYLTLDKVVMLQEHRIRELENYILDHCAEGAARVGIKKPAK